MGERDLFHVRTHLDRVRACEREWNGHSIPAATPRDQRYPLVYPRDTAAILRAIDRLFATGAAPEDETARALESAARFFVHAQGDDGLWGQRYDLEGRDRSIYRQEDNTAHAVSVLMRHVRHERRHDRISPIEDEAMRATERALRAAREHQFNERFGLYCSTTSVHESPIEEGFTLYVNGAFHDALRLAIDAERLVGREGVADRWTGQLEQLRRQIARHLIRDGRFIRRLTPDGRSDHRPDITLLAPHYFRFDDIDAEAEAQAVDHLEHELMDPDFGLLRRYPADHDDPGIHLHGGDGPYLSFSSWLAQRHAANGKDAKARDILERIGRLADDEGSLPEHVATRDAFAEFMAREWFTGRDFRKEFDPDILRPGVGFAPMLEEASRMTSAYAAGVRAADDAGDDIVRTALPHAWTHAEFALALAMLRPVRVEARRSGATS